ncbi:MAG: Alpha/Beta hydrolase protein [Monoraphidium minutum]|nr:MAG: Alpha/Beta hydrolase protein [Monoraphidium minutum]
MNAQALSIGRARPLRGAVSRTARVRVRCSANKSLLEEIEVEVRPGVMQGFWEWEGHRIRYQRSGEAGPAVLLVHGFGGNADHWRKSTPELGAAGHRAYAIDLLGYGYSDKPDPKSAPPNSIYCFETWGRQLVDFIDQEIAAETTIIANSVGGLAALQAGIYAPARVPGVQLINISLRGLHVSRQPPLQRPLVAALQRVLQETPLGRAFFGSVAKPQAVKNILRQCYARKDAVTDELVECILNPGLQPGAAEVFLDFIGYSGGPLPEDLIAQARVPVSLLWGVEDPWEDCKEGRRLFAPLPAVTEFVELPGCGHCPQDEAPELVNPRIAAFVASCVERRAAEGAPAAVAA